MHVDEAERRVAVGAERARAGDARRVRAEFPSTAAPAIVVVDRPALQQQAAAQRALSGSRRSPSARGIAHPPFTISGSADGTAAAVELPLTGAGNNAASRRAIIVLRQELIPQTLGRIPGVETAVTGDTAEDVDFTRQMKHGVPYVIVFVLDRSRSCCCSSRSARSSCR